MQSLAEVKAGEACTIKWMLGNPGVLEFMRRYGIEQGSLISVLQRGKDSMIIGRDGLRLAIGTEVAKRIKV